MVISDPAHWKEPYKYKGDKYDKVVEIITALNSNFLRPSSPYTIEYSAMIHMGLVQSQNTTIQVTANGVSQIITGEIYSYFEFKAPDWLFRIAEINGLTLTLTNITLRWLNNISASYLKGCDLTWADGDSSTTTSILNVSGLTEGNGSTGFRNYAFNPTDKSMVRGDTMHMNTIWNNSAANGSYMKSFQVIWTIT